MRACEHLQDKLPRVPDMVEVLKASAQVARLRGREATLVQQLQQAECRPDGCNV